MPPPANAYAQGSVAGVPILDDNGQECKAEILTPWGPLITLVSNVIPAADATPYSHLVNVGNHMRPLGLRVIATKTLLTNVVSAIISQMLSNQSFHVRLYDLVNDIDQDFIIQGDHWTDFGSDRRYEGRMYDKAIIGATFNFLGA